MKFNRVVLLFFLVGTTVLLAAGNGYKLFQQGLAKERAEADLRGAIQIYEQVVQESTADRKLASQALYRIGECQRALGDAEAKKSYERIVREYVEQEAVVALARQRLSEGRPLDGAQGDRVVWSGEDVLHEGGSVSPDGRYVSYTDWFFTGNLMLHDLASGKTRSLTPNKDWQGEGESNGSTFSPDGKRVAYGWQYYEPRGIELRIVDIEGGSDPQPLSVFQSSDIPSMGASDWSRDGQWIAVVITRKDRTRQIGLIRVKDGFLRVLKTVGWRGPNKLFFSPDGKYLAYDLPTSETASERDVYVIAVDGSGESLAVVHRAHDAVIGWSADGAQLLFSSNRTGTVGIWSVAVSNGKPQGAPSLLKPDTGWVSALGTTDSQAVYASKDTSTRALRLAPIDLETGKLTGPAVVESYGSDRPDWTRDGQYLAYRTQQPNGAPPPALSIRSLASGEVRHLPTGLQYFTNPRWSPDGRWLVAGGRDMKGKGAIRKLDPETGATSFLAPGVQGPEVSPDGKRIYYWDGKNYIALNIDSGETRIVFTEPENAQLGWGEGTVPGR
ncbi:MAG: tetratricopeptide repeat protein [Acidobacteria bacterium]|nr:tetratricopeptide repeat protein [Acidobacteriota bacterium]